MTPVRLVLLRLWGMTLGRFGFCRRQLRRRLERRMIHDADRPYSAASRYFDPDELSPR